MATQKPTAAKTANLKADTKATTTAKVPSKGVKGTAADPKASGTAVAVRKPSGGAVVDIRAQLQAQAAAMAGRTAPPTGNKIMPVRDGFKLPDGSKVPELTVCIVDFVTVHSFYERPYDPKVIVPPGCFAVGQNPRDMAPVPESPNLQAQNCQTCPMNEFGSSGEGKACKNGRRLAVLPCNEAGDDVDHEADILIIDVSPTALKGFDGYVQSISRTFQLPPVGVLTKISLDPNVEYAKLVFSDATPMASINEAFARQDEAKELLNVVPDFSGWVDPKAKPAGKAAGARR